MKKFPKPRGCNPGAYGGVMMEFPMRRLLPLIVVTAALCTAGTATAEDWYQWRGPEQNGVSREKNLPDTWSAKTIGENNLVWKQPYGGRTVPIVMNGRVYFINGVGEGVNEQERVMCLDAESGKFLWEHKFNVFLTDIVSDRVGWSSVVGDPETGNIYAHGVQGMLLCLNGKDGKVVWQHSLGEEYGRVSGYGGRVTSPTIDEDRLIVGMVNSSWGEYARGMTRFVAFDKKTGEILWWTETGHQVRNTYYSNPVVAVVNGERIMISGGGDGGVHAFKARTGEKLWSYLFGTGDINVTAVVDGNYIYIGHGGENLSGGERGLLLCLDASKIKDGKPEVVWSVSGTQFTFPSPVLLDDKLYIADEAATLYCYDLKASIAKKEGVKLWDKGYGKSAKGSPVWADGKIYATTVEGKVCIITPPPSGETEAKVKSVTLRSKTPGTALSINGGASVANGRVYFMTSEEFYCIGKPDVKPSADPIPPGPKEESAAKDAKATHLQVVPADVQLWPGDSASFKVRLFDDKGRFLREAKAEWEVAPFLAPPPIPGQPVQPGPPPPVLQGKITEDGKLTVSDKVPGQVGGVIAKAEGLTGRARVRVAARLPYMQDFEKVPEGRTPGGWVNTQGKFLVKKLKDGSMVLAKNNTVANTLVAKSNAYITLPSVGDYTIQADLMGSLKKDYLPDMGLVNSRYTLMLTGVGSRDGVGQNMKLLAWEAVPRIGKTVAFPWKPGTWYTMKLSVEPQGDKALVRGKVWEKGKDEPKEWTVEFEDPTPTLHGSPGLHGSSTDVNGPNDPGTEIYYDNVKVTPNKAAKPAAPVGEKGAAAPVAPPTTVVTVQELCVPAPICEAPRLFRRLRR
jgi:outer membrane protein assembly factor BamB